ncbi:CBS domain-containing protein [Neorhodopirellula lusitana]|uniref:CBS domain-containing protein n=1 Tax=Neorhodopirellula lusitana TaxID=445327 RepID=A0ABY1PTX0_9BACT|nr:CBS domain-containing protein [Neorhodopirellula lusitana]SMP43388.1 CBS domain-containing protein [Neorhodopirellula lusitana]
MGTTTTTQSPLLVSSVMQHRLVKLHENDTIQDAVEKLNDNHVSALPVVNDDDQLVGILTVTDLLRLVQDAEQSLEDRMTIYENCYWLTELIRDTLGNNEVTTAMSVKPITASADEPLERVANLMLDHKVHHIPITTDGKQLVGMVSSLDFVRLAATPA